LRDNPTTLTTTGFVLCLIERYNQIAMNAIDEALALNSRYPKQAALQ
jgi:hypothetical protein